MTADSYPLSGDPWLPDQEAAPPSKLSRLGLAFWVFFLNFLIVGYLAGGKSFAYLGIPQAKVFIGEIFLVGFVVAKPGAFFNTWVTSLVTRHPLAVFAWAHLAFLGYGLFETLRGISLGYQAAAAVLNLVFNVYPVYVFIGFWFARKVPGILERMIPMIALVAGIYGLAYVGGLSKYTGSYLIPGTNVSMIGQSGGAVISILGLIILGKKGFYHTFLILINVLTLLGNQVRGDWLGFLVGFVVWGAVSGNMRKVFRVGTILTSLVLVGFITDVRLPGVSTRGGETSIRDMVGRGLAGIDKETAREYSKDVDAFAGTLEWRKKWWREIWIAVHSSLENTFLGLGYGFTLTNLVTYIGESALRSPHSVFYYTLGYSGWVGVFLFAYFQVATFYAIWAVFRRTHQSLGLAIFVATLVAASAGNLLETPFGAIPFYTIVGMCLAQQKQDESSDAQLDDVPVNFHAPYPATANEMSPWPAFGETRQLGPASKGLWPTERM